MQDIRVVRYEPGSTGLSVKKEMQYVREVNDNDRRTEVSGPSNRSLICTFRRWIKAMINLKLLRLNPRAYCTKCWKEYTFEEWSKLPSYQTHPQYKARTKYCPDCKGEKFRWLG